MRVPTFLLVCVLVGFVVWGVKGGGSLPKLFRQRTCQGAAWQQAFPECKKEDIRGFLTLFMSAFAFRDEQKLLLSPEDQILQIYRALYPSRWTPDALELETLAKDLQRQYGLSLEAIWHDELTLGQLFAQVQSCTLG